ncbi:28179_t:CDS:2, partial [Gigaspora margarita]
KMLSDEEKDNLAYLQNFNKKRSVKSKRSLVNTFNNANIKSRTQSMLVYEQQNNKFGNMNSVVEILEDLNTLEKETNPDAKYWKGRILWQLGKNKEEASRLLKLAAFQGQKDALEFCKQNIFNKSNKQLVVISGATGDIGFNIAKAFLKYGYKKYVIKVIQHADSEYLDDKKLKRKNRSKKLEEGGAKVKLVNYNNYEELVKALTGAFWYAFEDKKDFHEALEKRKVVKKTEIMVNGKLEIKKEEEELSKVKLDYFYLYTGLTYECVVEMLDNHKFVNKAIRVNGISLTLGDVHNKFVASYKKFVADTEWSDMYPYEDITNLSAIDNEGIKVLQARNLDLGPGTLTEKELGFKLDNNLDRVIEIFIRTNSKEQLDLSHLHEFPELLNDLFN